MGAPTQGTRVTLFLPVNNSREQAAAAQVISHVTRLYGGVTSSMVPRPVFTGSWVSGGAIVRDRIALTIVDVSARELSDSSFCDELDALRAYACQTYERFGALQQVIWLGAHRIGLFSDPCQP